MITPTRPSTATSSRRTARTAPRPVRCCPAGWRSWSRRRARRPGPRPGRPAADLAAPPTPVRRPVARDPASLAATRPGGRDRRGRAGQGTSAMHSTTSPTARPATASWRRGCAWSTQPSRKWSRAIPRTLRASSWGGCWRRTTLDAEAIGRLAGALPRGPLLRAPARRGRAGPRGRRPAWPRCCGWGCPRDQRRQERSDDPRPGRAPPSAPRRPSLGLRPRPSRGRCPSATWPEEAPLHGARRPGARPASSPTWPGWSGRAGPGRARTRRWSSVVDQPGRARRPSSPARAGMLDPRHRRCARRCADVPGPAPPPRRFARPLPPASWPTVLDRLEELLSAAVVPAATRARAAELAQRVLDEVETAVVGKLEARSPWR